MFIQQPFPSPMQSFHLYNMFHRVFAGRSPSWYKGTNVAPVQQRRIFGPHGPYTIGQWSFRCSDLFNSAAHEIASDEERSYVLIGMECQFNAGNEKNEPLLQAAHSDGLQKPAHISNVLLGIGKDGVYVAFIGPAREDNGTVILDAYVLKDTIPFKEFQTALPVNALPVAPVELNVSDFLSLLLRPTQYDDVLVLRQYKEAPVGPWFNPPPVIPPYPAGPFFGGGGVSTLSSHAAHGAVVNQFGAAAAAHGHSPFTPYGREPVGARERFHRTYDERQAAVNPQRTPTQDPN